MKPKHLLTLLFAICMVLPSAAQRLSLIPQPADVEWKDGIFFIDKDATIEYNDAALKPAADYLTSLLNRATGYQFNKAKRKGTILLQLTAAGKPGSYALKVSGGGIVILGNEYAGVMNGIATLRQLLPKEIEQKEQRVGKSLSVPHCTIVDEPRFDWRGMHLDCSRHFFTKEEVKELLDVLALYKINKFHWHLTDDQGWRIEIKKYPLLTQNGGWRTFNNQDTICLNRAKDEDRADLQLPTEKLRQGENGETLYGGFYTQDDIREVVAYAAQRAIDVIPEIDIPGHSLCAINNYDGLSCFEQTGWGKLFTTPLCPGKDKSLEFFKDVYTEVFSLFPYEYVMMGADEVDQSNWTHCPDCQQRMKDNHLETTQQLQAWFVHKMEDFFRANHRKMIGWDEIIAGGLSETATVMWWRSWNPSALKDATSHGNQVICTPNNEFYLDYSDDGNRLKSIFDFNPQPSDLTAAEQQLVLGVQGNLWAEQVPSRNRIYYQAFPRMLAVAELGWSIDHDTWDGFHSRLLNQLPRLQELGLTYRVPDITGFYRTNAFTDKAEIHLQCDDPSAVIRYTTDGTIPSASSQQYTGTLTVSESTSFRFRSFNKQGMGGETFVADYIKEDFAPALDIICVQPGLDAAWYDYDGPTCKDIDTAPLNGYYVVDGIQIPQEASGNIGLVISGNIYVPQDDIYTFHLLSDDGSYLMIDNQMVVDNDGEHSPLELVGQHAMLRGQHPILARYFDHNGGQLRLRITDSKGQDVKVWFFH